MNAATRNGTIAFQPRAKLLKLIGEQLISDEVVAISELVKNAHDADALTVTIAFRGVTGGAGEIEIRDDGCGMDRDTLLGRWMEPAASTKVGRGRQVTRLGRRVLGEKGVGRFAADKLSRNLEIVSRCPGSREEICATIDWDRFDTDELMLADVQNQWELRSARAISTHGTLLRMTRLRSTWTERMFRRLSLRLSRLLSPFSEHHRFTIHIESDEFPEYSGELRADFLERAPYRVEASFDGEQTISISLNGRRTVHQTWNGHGELTCGPVRVRLFAFDLEGEALARIGPRMEVRAWLREWTGVSIYRDGFRIWPYGEPHDDWLRLDQRRVNNPVERLSNNQVIGFIDIGRDRNPELMDQTNREGLIHNRALEDLRRLVYFVFQSIEATRQEIRHPPRRDPILSQPVQNEERSIVGELEQLAARADGDLAREIRQVARSLEDREALEEAQRQTTNEGYSGLAAVGQMVAGLSPLLPMELERMRMELERMRLTLARRKAPEARQSLDEIASSLSSLEEYIRMMLAATGNGERRRAIDITAEISSYREFILPLLESRGVEMEILCPTTGVYRTEMRPENFYCLLQILTVNSLDWLRGQVDPRIRISVTGLPDGCEIIFSDNGPGIASEISHCIFNPLFSCKEGGRGMGLTIARQVVVAHGGRIHLILDGRRRGANFRITLPRKRSRATIYSS